MRVGVLTSGGDSAGMNACVYAIAKNCEMNNIECMAVKNGYQGLIENKIININANQYKKYIFLGGTHIGSSRSAEFMSEAGLKAAVKNIKDNNIDCLVVIGGNGSLAGAQTLESAGIKTICIPGSIDNDLAFDHSLGYDSAVNAAVSATDAIYNSICSCGKIAIIECMGRDDADITRAVGKATQADIILDKKLTMTQIKAEINAVLKKNVSPLVIIKEKMHDENKLTEYLTNNLKNDFRYQSIGYIQRGCNASAFDREYAYDLGMAAVQMIQKGKSGIALGDRQGKIIAIKYEKAILNNN